MVGIVVLLVVLVGLLLIWWQGRAEHERKLANLRVRVYVNGIRGKSTVTRLIAGVLRESGLRTLGKTTGSAAMVLLPDGSEEPVVRRAAATIMEIVETVNKYVDDSIDAIVFETMALHPVNQRASSELMVKSNIAVITNVREDHQDVMGESLEEIADTMSLMIPKNGILISAEDRPHLRERLRRNAERRGSRFIYADPAWVKPEDLAGFHYLSFAENVAIGLAVADLTGIPRATAMRGMWRAQPDVGVVNIQHVEWNGKRIVWAPLFAVNDRESTVISLELLRPYHAKDATRIGILNNRPDRAKRAMQFADIAALDLHLDYLITFGAYELQVTERMVELGYPRECILNLGSTVNPTFNQIMDAVAGAIKGEEGILVGMVNIHTPQAELLIEFFNHRPDAPDYLNQEMLQKRYRPRQERLKTHTQVRLGENRR
jgi:poly-gamma-glutamate synthase PgsB/CapB